MVQATAQPLGVVHGAEAGQQAVIQHAADPLDQFAFRTAELVGCGLEGPFADREAFLQLVDNAAIERVHQRVPR